MMHTSSTPPSSCPQSPRETDIESFLPLEMDEDQRSQSSDCPRLAYSRSTSVTSTSSGSFDSSSSPSPSPKPSFTQRLRNRVRNVLHVNTPAYSTPPLDDEDEKSKEPQDNNTRLMSHFLMGPHNFENQLPFPPGPERVRKGSDFDHDLLKKSTSFTTDEETDETALLTVRTREQVVLHFLMELQMLKRDSALIIFGIFYQWFHSAATNLAYYYHAQLTAAQRVPLQDAMFAALPTLNGAWWMASEYLVYGMIITTVALIVSILFIRWNAPHRRPLYCIPILRRMLITLVAAQTLRIISFMITTLPGASRQCLYDVPEDMERSEMMEGPAHDRGNPEGWAPPKDWSDILWRVDATNGCGDLMFSSHTIFTCLFICIVFRYFNWSILKWSMVATQLFAIPFILAAHKHYSVDVFTALYVTPLLFYFFTKQLPDKDVKSSTMALHYNIRFYRDAAGGHVMMLWGNEFYMVPADLPLDLQREYQEQRPLKVLTEHSNADMLMSSTEVAPMIV